MNGKMTIHMPVPVGLPEIRNDLDWAHQWVRDILGFYFDDVSITQNGDSMSYSFSVPWGDKERDLTRNRFRGVVDQLRYMAQRDDIHVVWPDGSVD